MKVNIESLISSKSLDELRRLQGLISTRINTLSNDKTPININQYIAHESGVIPSDLLRRCHDEVLTLKFKEKGLDTVWVCEVDEQYVFKGYNRNKSVALMRDFPALKELLILVNESGYTTGDANAILVTRYPDGTTKLNWHSDDESGQISQNSSICVVPIGATRWIQFRKKLRHIASRRKKRKCQVLESYEMIEGDLVIMKPGCQQVLEHRVPPVSECGGVDGVRHALSCRTFLPSELEALINGDSTVNEPFSPESPKSDLDSDPEVSFNIPTDSKKAADIPISSKPLPSAIVLAGDSFITGLDETKLRKKKDLTICNIAQSGFTIAKVRQSLATFHNENCSSLQVSKLFLSIGTNDIRNFNNNGVRYLRRPIFELVQFAKKLFPKATIFIQSLLPLPVTNRRFIVEDISELNKILFNVSMTLKTQFMDLMNPLLDSSWVRNHLLFKKGGNIHPNKRGYSVIGSIYLDAIHGKRFCPLNW